MIFSWLKCVGFPLLTAVAVYCFLCLYAGLSWVQYLLPFAIWLVIVAAGLTGLWWVAHDL